MGVKRNVHASMWFKDRINVPSSSLYAHHNHLDPAASSFSRLSPFENKNQVSMSESDEPHCVGVIVAAVKGSRLQDWVPSAAAFAHCADAARGSGSLIVCFIELLGACLCRLKLIFLPSCVVHVYPCIVQNIL